jgi:hypothetical protein
MHPALYRKLKILSIIGVSLLLSRQIDNTFFIAHTPTVNMAAVERLTHPELPTIDTQYIASLFQRPTSSDPRQDPNTVDTQNPNQDPSFLATTMATPVPSTADSTLTNPPAIAPALSSPTLAPQVIDFVATNTIADQKQLLRNQGFVEVGAGVFYGTSQGQDELIIPPAVQMSSSTAIDENGQEIILLSAQ